MNSRPRFTLAHVLLRLASWQIALLAAVVFTVVEALVKHAFLPMMSLDIYFIIRLFVAILFLSQIIRFLGKDFHPFIVSLAPLKIPFVYWLRGFFSLLSMLSLTIALLFSPYQAFSYGCFLLHPLWTISFGRLFRSEAPSAGQRPLRLWPPITLTVISVLLYSTSAFLLPRLFDIQTVSTPPHMAHVRTICTLSSTTPFSPNTLLILCCIFASLAGLCFAMTNIFTAKARLTLPLPHRDNLFITASTIEFYTDYVASAFFVIVYGGIVLFAAHTLPLWCIDWSWFGIAAIGGLVVASMAFTFAAVMFSRAFIHFADQAVSSIMDISGVPISLAIGLLTTELSPYTFYSIIGGTQLMALLLTFAGAEGSSRCPRLVNM